MRKLILATVSLVCMFGIAHAGSFITMDKKPTNNSSIETSKPTTIFDLYGPSASDCVKLTCPSQEKLERLARRGATVMKVSGGDVQVLENVFASMPKNSNEVETAIISNKNDREASPEMAVAMPEALPDDFKTGPLSDGSIQADVAGVDTEFLPDLVPEFEPELASSIEDPAIVMETVSDESMNALSNAF